MDTTSDRPVFDPAAMARRVAHFAELKGSREAFLDTRIPQYARTIINVLSWGVGENTKDPDLRSQIEADSPFNLTLVKADPGKGAALHAHPTLEVFMCLSGRWAVRWLEGEIERRIELNPFDTVAVPIEVYRGFVNIGETEAVLLAVIAEPPDGAPNRVDWHPSVVEEARATGLELDERGSLREVS